MKRNKPKLERKKKSHLFPRWLGLPISWLWKDRKDAPEIRPDMETLGQDFPRFKNERR
jgi:hypothetical protein